MPFLLQTAGQLLTAGYDKLSLCTEIGQYTEGEVKIKALIFLDYPIISISR